MRLFKEFKPRIMKADTKPLLEMKIRNNWKSSGWKISNTGSGMCVGNKRIMVNYQKFRSKRGVRNAHWIAYVYTFDEEFLSAAGLKVVQHTRDFNIQKVE